MVLEHRTTTFDELSMERSKSFDFALQELNNLKPQLYSAAECFEKTYIHSDQKQKVLDNMKDYALRALVNAVDHLGTVACKITDPLEQQALDVSAMDLKISTLNQKLLTCQTYTDKEGLRKQQLLAFIPRHHKHYILPSFVNKNVHSRTHRQIDARQNPFQTRTCLQSSGTPVSRTLSWHLASETKSTLKKTSNHDSKNIKNPDFSANNSGVFHLLDNKESTRKKTSATEIHLPFGVPTSGATIQTLGVKGKDALEGVQVRNSSKSVLSPFFVKQKGKKKGKKLKAGSVS
ncbi:protein ABIL1-like [Gastrolobium bilobum]|uniref:protein ABIL1-like n=1 Tax=Gastrolobium bilobum TaxID=150636 RepID=UPI002AB304C2|nr:protein ABIL1-like [Gastrolobium bilobum]